MSTILKVDDINVYYGSIHAIKGISFEVNEGEIVTLIGANGAGKSTTLNTISGLLHSKTGHIEFMGEPLNHVPSHKVVSKGLALVPEGRRIFLQMSVQENLDMGAFSRKGGDIEGDMERVFEQFPRLKERRRQIAGTLSGGEQQMLAMLGYVLYSGGCMRSISIEELRSEVEAYIEAAKSASGDSAVRYLNRAETALRSYDGVPERFKNTYFRLIEDIRNDLEQ